MQQTFRRTPERRGKDKKNGCGKLLVYSFTSLLSLITPWSLSILKAYMPLASGEVLNVIDSVNAS